jgi:hypothetical protein
MSCKKANKICQREMDKYFVYMVKTYDNKDLDLISKLNNYDYINLRSGDYHS